MVWMLDDDEMYLPAKVWKTGFNKVMKAKSRQRMEKHALRSDGRPYAV